MNIGMSLLSLLNTSKGVRNTYIGRRGDIYENKGDGSVVATARRKG